VSIAEFSEQDLVLFYATGTSGTIGRYLPRKFHRVNADLSSENSINKIAFEKNSRVLHLAGIVGTEQVKKDVDLAYRVNVQGSLRLAQKFLDSDGDLFVYVSSSHVYQGSEERIIEESPINPLSTYAEQKVAVEVGLQEMFSECAGKLSIVRVFSILDWDTKPFTLGGAVKKIRDQQDGVYIRNSDDVRDFTTPRNAAVVLQTITDIRLNGITNLCSGIGRSVSAAVTEMLKSSSCEVPDGVIIPGNSDIPYLVGNPSRLTSAVPYIKLNWEPRASFVE